MGLRIKEMRERKKIKLQIIEQDMLKKEAQRFGGYSQDPEGSEHAFLYKVKAVRTQFQDVDSVNEAADDFARNLRGIENHNWLPISKIEPSLLLELL